MVGPIPAISAQLSGLLVATVVLACCLCCSNQHGRPILSMVAMVLSKAFYAFAAGFDQLHFGVVIALRTFRRETAAAWRDAEESR